MVQDEHERDFYRRSSQPMTKQDKLEEIRRMRAELQGGPNKENNERE
jgi:hypothetical protein